MGNLGLSLYAYQMDIVFRNVLCCILLCIQAAKALHRKGYSEFWWLSVVSCRGLMIQLSNLSQYYWHERTTIQTFFEVHDKLRITDVETDIWKRFRIIIWKRIVNVSWINTNLNDCPLRGNHKLYRLMELYDMPYIHQQNHTNQTYTIFGEECQIRQLGFARRNQLNVERSGFD